MLGPWGTYYRWGYAVYWCFVPLSRCFSAFFAVFISSMFLLSLSLNLISRGITALAIMFPYAVNLIWTLTLWIFCWLECMSFCGIWPNKTFLSPYLPLRIDLCVHIRQLFSTDMSTKLNKSDKLGFFLACALFWHCLSMITVSCHSESFLVAHIHDTFIQESPKEEKPCLNRLNGIKTITVQAPLNSELLLAVHTHDAFIQGRKQVRQEGFLWCFSNQKGC